MTSQPAYDIQILEAEPRLLVSISAQFSFREVPTRLLGVLNEVWAFIRANSIAPTGHNVVLYDEHGMTAAGVEVFAAVPHDLRVLSSATPSGRVATTVHWGDYDELGSAHSAINDWCAANAHPITRTHWEVYGDWSNDPAQRRTDVFYLLA